MNTRVSSGVPLPRNTDGPQNAQFKLTDSSSSQAVQARYVHELFALAAARDPEAIAVVSEAGNLSYGELELKANQLANHLRSGDIGRGSIVGICVDRSPAMIIGLLGILKAGGAYLPLDPLYPRNRLQFMIEDAGVSTLLIQERWRESFSDAKVDLVGLDTDREIIESQSKVLPDSESLSGDDSAYVIYTSGSTGKPKGVVVAHSGLANYLNWAASAYEVAAGIGAPVHSSISFDLTITSLLAPLVTGRTAFLITEEEGIEGLARALLARTNYSLIKITPAHLRILSELLPPDQIAERVRVLVIGGEALHLEHLAIWRRFAPSTE